ncbi:rhodanese-like domain-containing protein [Acetobacteraceae bacterium KSS8]|uniref:Rhodanese-like domain-containing protein n=1 Tax=Endosaccharibacter trunci TaxID=2812733 RepID=A0ABT1W5F2_9PROT|nr:rhodanese-like domain-containing protein [Acetobacteraceae bacterium KSS8]
MSGRRETRAEAVRARLRDGAEIALIDLREEGPFSRAHPLFAVNIPLGRIELMAPVLLPNRAAPVVLYGEDDPVEGTDLAGRALSVFARLGYSEVSVLEGGLEGWRTSGGELFRDVHVPGKAFGELVEARARTPSLPAEALRARLDGGDDLVVLDARRFEEYRTMTIPGSRSVPGGELALRARDAAPDPRTTVVVNCAGRTRSIIGAQSLRNAGIPNPVFALRNGTIGWTLAGLELEHEADRTAPAASGPHLEAARARAAALAERTGVQRIDAAGLAALDDGTRTLFRLDVRQPEEYRAAHPAGFANAPGGQLVQATDEWVGVRHATLVLFDDDGVRANMAAHWLRQLGWRQVYVLEGWHGLAREEGDAPAQVVAPAWQAEPIDPAALARLLDHDGALVIDVTRSVAFRTGHIPGALFCTRAALPVAALAREERTIVLTCGTGALARHAASDLIAAGIPARLLQGGTAAWRKAGFPVSGGLSAEDALSSTDDTYKRPYEGTDNAHDAMQAYLDWEYGLVAQLERDGTHGFFVLEA